MFLLLKIIYVNAFLDLPFIVALEQRPAMLYSQWSMAKNHPLRVFCSTLKSNYILLADLFNLMVAQFVHQDDAGFGSGNSRLSPDNILQGVVPLAERIRLHGYTFKSMSCLYPSQRIQTGQIADIGAADLVSLSYVFRQ